MLALKLLGMDLGKSPFSIPGKRPDTVDCGDGSCIMSFVVPRDAPRDVGTFDSSETMKASHASLDDSSDGSMGA